MWHNIVYEPLLNALVWVYNVIGIADFGIAVAVLSVVIRLVLWPVVLKEVHARQAMQKLQPHMARVREEHKGDREKQARAVMDLYKEHKVNPLSSCLPLLIQLPFFIGLYQVITHVTRGDLSGLYGSVMKPENINFLFLGLVDLSRPNWYLAIAAAAAQFFQGRLLQAQQAGLQDPSTEALTKQMQYIMPIVTVFIALRLPSALALLWALNAVLAVLQQMLIMKFHPVHDK